MFKGIRYTIKELVKINQELEKENQNLINEIEKLDDESVEAWNHLKEYSRTFEELESEKNKILNDYQKIENQLRERDKEIEELKIEILDLKEILKIEKSNWKIQVDNASRINPITCDLEQHQIPYDFDESMVRDLKFTNNGKTREFRYLDKSEPYNRGTWKFFINIPTPLYNQLVDEKEKCRYPIYKNDSNKNIQNINDLKNFLKKKGLTLKGKYGENIFNFIFENIGKSFSTGDFIENCQFKNRESARQYLQKLQDSQVIRRYGQGNYRLII